MANCTHLGHVDGDQHRAALARINEMEQEIGLLAQAVWFLLDGVADIEISKATKCSIEYELNDRGNTVIRRIAD